MGRGGWRHAPNCADTNPAIAKVLVKATAPPTSLAARHPSDSGPAAASSAAAAAGSFAIASDTALPSGVPWLEYARRCIMPRPPPTTLSAVWALGTAQNAWLSPLAKGLTGLAGVSTRPAGYPTREVPPAAERAPPLTNARLRRPRCRPSSRLASRPVVHWVYHMLGCTRMPEHTPPAWPTIGSGYSLLAVYRIDVQKQYALHGDIPHACSRPGVSRCRPCGGSNRVSFT